MQRHTFSISTALGNVFRLKHTKGTRMPILLGWLLIFILMALLIFITVDIDIGQLQLIMHSNQDLVMHADAYNSMQSVVVLKFSFQQRLIYFIMMAFLTLVNIILVAGMIMLAVNKQRSHAVSMGLLFKYFSKADKFLPILLVVLLLSLALPGPHNLLGFNLDFHRHPVFILLFFIIFLAYMVMSMLIGLATPLVADKSMSGFSAIKNSVIFMWCRANFLKLLWVSVILGMVMAAACVAAGIILFIFILIAKVLGLVKFMATLGHDRGFLILLAIAVFYLIVIAIICPFLPGLTHMNAYIYRSIMGELEPIDDSMKKIINQDGSSV